MPMIWSFSQAGKGWKLVWVSLIKASSSGLGSMNSTP